MIQNIAFAALYMDIINMIYDLIIITLPLMLPGDT